MKTQRKVYGFHENDMKTNSCRRGLKPVSSESKSTQVQHVLSPAGNSLICIKYVKSIVLGFVHNYWQVFEGIGTYNTENKKFNHIKLLCICKIIPRKTEAGRSLTLQTGNFLSVGVEYSLGTLQN